MKQLRVARPGFLLLAVMIAGALPLLAEVDAKSFKRASGMYRKGENALRVGKIDEARTQFNNALEIVPGLPAADIGLGNIAMSEQKFDLALKHYEAARDGWEEMSAAMLNLQQQRYAGVRKQISALQDSINNLRSNSTSGGVNLQLSQLELAVQQLEVIKPPSADDPAAPAEVHFYVGNALFRLGRFDEAAASFERCRKRDPGFAMVYNNLALIHWRAGRADEARSSLARAEELGFPVNPQFKKDIGLTE